MTCSNQTSVCVRENDGCMASVSPQWALDAYRSWKLLGLPPRTWLSFFEIAFHIDALRTRGAA